MRRSLLVLFSLVAAAACSSVSEVSSNPLVGRWRSPVEALQPGASIQTTLTFDARGGAMVDVRTFNGETVSAYWQTTGRFHVEGNQVSIEATRLVWWDRFYGDDSPVHVESPPAHSGPYRDVTFSIDGDQLTLHYVTYPADAPVATTATFRRAP